MISTCVICGEDFTSTNPAKYCSKACRSENRRRDEYLRRCKKAGVEPSPDVYYHRPRIVTCDVCGAVFETTNYLKTVCSNLCQLAKRRVQAYKKVCEKQGREMKPEKTQYNLVTKVNFCLSPSRENCLNCKFDDCVCNLPATEEEVNTINEMIERMYNRKSN